VSPSSSWYVANCCSPPLVATPTICVIWVHPEISRIEPVPEPAGCVVVLLES
jgi:hypothetical protein